MIIQCDQCNTKFKLDDAKVPDKGIKVRCAKCKQVFMVQKETTAEETDLDFLLSGLGTQAPEAGAEISQTQSVASAVTVEQLQAPVQGAGPLEEESPAGGGFERAPSDEFDKDFFATKEVLAAQETKSPDYGDFSFDEEEKETPSEEAAPSAVAAGSPGEFDFGEFPFDAESAEQAGTAPPAGDVPSETERFEFGEFSAEELVQTRSERDSGSIVSGESVKDEFTFEEESEEPRDEAQAAGTEAPVLTEAGEFDFGEFAVQAEEEKGVEIKPATEAQEVVSNESEGVGFEPTEVVNAQPVMKDEERKPDIDFIPSSQAEPVPMTAFSPEIPTEEEELPPLAISTRKRGHSIFSIAVTTIIVLIVLAIAGVGFYVFKTGPSAFNKLGLSFLAKWAGMESIEEGGITIRNPQGGFMVNKEAGEIFVVKGEAVNNFKKPRASIQVKASVLGPKGEVLMQKTAYCGNFLSQDQLTTLPMAKMEEAMASPFGDSLTNLGVQPGKSIPFVIVFGGVQKNASEFSVEVVGSTVADQ